MSSVTMCDFCMTTTRTSAEFKKVKLPRAAVPEALRDVGTGELREFDACGECMADIGDTLGGLLIRKLGGSLDVNTPPNEDR